MKIIDTLASFERLNKDLLFSDGNSVTTCDSVSLLVFVGFEACGSEYFPFERFLPAFQSFFYYPPSFF